MSRAIHDEDAERNTRIRAKLYELLEAVIDNLLAAMKGEQGQKRRFNAPLIMCSIQICKLCDIKVSPAARTIQQALGTLRGRLDAQKEVEQGESTEIPGLHVEFGLSRKTTK